MAARGKNNGTRKKDKPRTGRGEYKAAAVVSGIFFLFLASFLVLPAFSPKCLSLSKLIVNFVRNAFSGLSAFNVLTYVGAKKGEKNRISAILAACLIILVPNTAVAFGGQAVFEFYQEQQQKDEETEQIDFIDLHDGLFEMYSADSLHENRELLVALFSKEIMAGDSKLNKKDISEYEALTEEAYDYEAAYLFFAENNLFTGSNSQERIEYIESSRLKREKAETWYSTWDNRRCIALRYNDRGYEECRVNRSSDAVETYTEGIYWGLMALKLQYETDGYDEENTNKIIDSIIRSYTGVTEAKPTSAEEHKKAEILIEIFENVRLELKKGYE